MLTSLFHRMSDRRRGQAETGGLPRFGSRLHLLLIFTLLVGALGGVLPAQVSARANDLAYIEPALLDQEAPTAAVIVMADSTEHARRAVQRVGGEISSDLWLIRAVAATIPARRVEALAAMSGIRSVVSNKGVKSSDGGWVTETRIKKATYTLPSNQLAPATPLSDGGFVSIGEKGNILVTNPDGTVRASFTLPNGPFKTSSVVAGSDLIYSSSESKHIYAFTPDGVIRWHYNASNGSKFLGGLATSGDGALYAVDERGLVYSIDSATGRLRWTFTAAGTGLVIATPIVGPDGTLYFDTDKGFVYAVNPDGTQRWRYNTAQALKLSPFIGPTGSVYVASTDGKTLFALDQATGALRYRFTVASKILAQPAVGPDGSVYIAAEDRSLHALNPNGTQRFLFRPVASKFLTSPVLSKDGSTVYAAIEEKVVYAVDTRNGAERWRYTMLGKIKATPTLDDEGGLLIGSDGKDLVRLSAAGRETFRTTLNDVVTQSPRAERSGNASIRVGSATVLTIGRLHDRWDGRPDVQATDNKRIWKQVYSAAIDAGADEVHKTLLPSGVHNRGTGVGVAVVDSGVYFDKAVKDELGTVIQKQYLGQADFVNHTCESFVKNGTLYVSGTQFPGYCMHGADTSKDSYGHGTAVASIIWNNFTDFDTGVSLGIAPGANVLSVRVLDHDGTGSYETVIKGIQYVVANRANFNIRVLNLSLSALMTTPYFVDPLNRAVEEAWKNGIVVVAAAGNLGPAAETITVPGNDPYVITVGAVNGKRTAGYWADDVLPDWSATGPTLDGFAKPDILAPGAQIISFMYRDTTNSANSSYLVQQHPDNSLTPSLFRMNGTSMSTAVASGVVALMLQRHPALTPDQVKYRLLDTARPAVVSQNNDLVYNVLQQGAGRVWAADAVLSTYAVEGNGNAGMNIATDLAHGYEHESELAYHYQGPVRKLLSDDGRSYLYYIENEGKATALGATWANGMGWIDRATLASGKMSWAGGKMSWAGGLDWAGGLSLAAGKMSWAGGKMSWAGGKMSWAGGKMSWAGGKMSWAGGTSWVNSPDASASGKMSWSGTINATTVPSTSWVVDGPDW